jgi:hypothetical protein
MAQQLITEYPDIKVMVENNPVLGMMLHIFISRNIPKSDIYDSLVILKDYKDVQNFPPDDVQAKLPASVRALLKKMADEQKSHGMPSGHSISPVAMGISTPGMGGDVSMIINNAISPMQNGIIAIQSSLLNIEGNVQTILSQIAAASGGPATAPEPNDDNSNNIFLNITIDTGTKNNILLLSFIITY